MPETDPKRLEADRYDRRARAALQADAPVLPDGDGAGAVPPALRRPYEVFEEQVRAAVQPGVELLDVCCGTGRYSLVGALAGARVTAADLAENNLVLVQRRAARAGLTIETAVADAERLPFAAAAFDVVTCVGSLSYVDLAVFVAEIRRVLRPGGRFICVDSLNHNPVYRLNRRLQHWRGERGLSTLQRMPTCDRIERLAEGFELAEVSYHGVLSFLAPLACRLAGEQLAAAWLDSFDQRHPALKRWAFKFVFSGSTPTA